MTTLKMTRMLLIKADLTKKRMRHQCFLSKAKDN